MGHYEPLLLYRQLGVSRRARGMAIRSNKKALLPFYNEGSYRMATTAADGTNKRHLLSNGRVHRKPLSANTNRQSQQERYNVFRERVKAQYRYRRDVSSSGLQGRLEQHGRLLGSGNTIMPVIRLFVALLTYWTDRDGVLMVGFLLCHCGGFLQCTITASMAYIGGGPHLSCRASHQMEALGWLILCYTIWSMPREGTVNQLEVHHGGAPIPPLAPPRLCVATNRRRGPPLPFPSNLR